MLFDHYFFKKNSPSGSSMVSKAPLQLLANLNESRSPLPFLLQITHRARF